ncbi:hypothetical protein L5515_013195 [Caenorhabditis briggsae]|uniref:Protein CBR-TAG-218 n=1 Tax=Caenorhabditis briggsae TaxID=6238 RepID=A0AAE9E5R3_CAEBR|nr:hypothetical protein L5515_013195 [Caenorhabditis briggsae]
MSNEYPTTTSSENDPESQTTIQTTTQTKMRLLSVKELAKRFESGARIEHKPVTAKRIGKFRVIENNNHIQQGRVVRGSAIPRRKSSLKRRTRSSSELAVLSTSSDFRKSKSTDDFSPGPNTSASFRIEQPCSSRSTVVEENLESPRPAPRQRALQATSMIVEGSSSSCSLQDSKPFSSNSPEASSLESSRKDATPIYEERCRVSLTIPITSEPSPVSPPPPIPSAPPSQERIKRIPSYLKPTPAPRSMSSSTLPRARLKTPPPPPPVGMPGPQGSTEGPLRSQEPTGESLRFQGSQGSQDPAEESLRFRGSQGGSHDTYPNPQPLLKSHFGTLPVNFRNPVRNSITSNFPRIPSIPVPDVPFTEAPEDDGCYEEIMLVTPHESSTSYIPTHRKSAELADYCTYESTDFTKPDVMGTVPRNFLRDEEVFDEAEEEEEVPKVKERFLSSTLQSNPKSTKRVSSMELEKLFRFKSELQLNLSKKVGQLRQKVGDKSAKRRSKCHVSVDLLDTDFTATMSKSSCVDKPFQDDDHIYGDDWSSDDDDIFHDDRRSSMYRQLEEQLNKAFPEYQSRSQISSDYESADLLLDPVVSARPASSSIMAESEKSFLARPAVGHLPLDDSWTPTSDEPSPGEEEYKRQYTCRMVPNEQPLYQHYMMEAVVVGETAEDPKTSTMEEIKEEIPVEVVMPVQEVVALKPATRRESSISSDSGRGADCSTTSASALTSNTSMRRDRLVGTSNFGSQRSLWCELPEVRAAGLLEKLDDVCKLRQEAYFEVITSEASYLRSLNVLITHFMASPQMLGSKSALSVLSDSDRKHLFSNIFAVRDCSERLLCDLETRLEENLILDDICDILSEHFEKHFEVYIKYCSNQVYQDRTLRRLKSENPGFLSAVQRLEENKQCQGLDMRSFLMLPMQRITRYPLLLYAILDRIPTTDDRYKTATEALTSSNRVVRDCNEGARRMERTEQLLDIDRRLIYKDADLKRIPLVSNSRYLVKKGVLTQLVERRSSNILQSRQKARTLHVFLFSDMIMITKKKLNGTFVCKDYAARRFVDMQPIEPDNPKIPLGAVSNLVGRPHLFLCTLMRNAREKQTELLLSADSETDRERWLSAVRPPTSTNPEEKIYAEWDCPQAIVVHPYQPSQADELVLNIGDSLNILRKMPDGWLFGERAAGDSMGGWFPSSYVQPIINDHTRANNYRQRLRIIQAAAGWHGNASPSTTRSGGMPLMDRLRRMSNPKTYFQSGTVGN